MLHVGHSTEYGEHALRCSCISECPRGHSLLGVACLEVAHEELRQFRQSAAEQRLHDDGRYAPLLQFGIEVTGVGVAAVDFVGEVPVEIIEFDLNEIPLVFVVVLEQMVEDGYGAVIGESEIAYASGLPLFQEEVEHAVVDVSVVEFLDAASSDGVEKIVVDVIYLQFLHGVAVHLDGLLALPSGGVEVGKFRCHEVVFARVAMQGDARSALGEALTVSGRRVEIVHSVLNSIIHLTVNHLLVGFFLAVIAGFHRQSHHSVSEE